MFAAFLLALVPLKYTALELHQMILGADRIVAGTIVELDNTTYRLRVEHDLLGNCAERELRVRRFVNWTCAHRWQEYEVGERLVLFATNGTGNDQLRLHVMSGGGEGEIPVRDESVLVSGTIRGALAVEVKSLGTRTRVPLAELKDAIAEYRRCFVRDGPSVFRTPILASGVDEVAIEELAARSPLLRHLCKYSYAYSRGPVFPAPEGARGDVAAISLADPAFATPAKASASMRSRWTRYDWSDLALAFCADADDERDVSIAIASWRHDSESVPRTSEHVVLARHDGAVRAVHDLRKRSPDLRATLSKREAVAPSIANVGDLDADGVDEIAIGGRVWADTPSTLRIAFLDRDRNVRESVDLGAQSLVRDASNIIDGDFGRAVARIGDLDGDGTIEIAVARGNGRVSRASGRSVLLLSLDARGVASSVASIPREHKPNMYLSRFGEALCGLGDVNGDGVPDLAISDPSGVGVVWIFLLARNGEVLAPVRIGDGIGGFDGFVLGEAAFGSCLAPLGDLDRDGVVDLLVGSERHLWCLFLNRDGTVKSHRAIREVDGPFDIGRSVATRIDPARPDVVQVAASGERRTKDGLFEPVVWLFALDREGKIVVE